jgi:hypothetical protein
MTKRVILVSGYARTGKDTFADALITSLDSKAKRLKFASALRKATDKALKALGISLDVWSEDEATKALVRPLLVEMARLARAVDKDVFARSTLSDSIYALSVNGEQTVVITDLRYENEIKLFREAGKQLGWDVQRVHLEREGTHAAHEEELVSIDLLNKSDEPDWQSTFANGDLEGIKNFALMFSRSIASSESL